MCSHSFAAYLLVKVHGDVFSQAVLLPALLTVSGLIEVVEGICMYKHVFSVPWNWSQPVINFKVKCQVVSF